MIVYTETNSRRDGITDIEYQTRLVTDIKKSVWKTPNKVSLVESVLLTGHPTHQILNKRWWRWYTTASMGFYRNKFGNIVIYNCSRTPNGRRSTPFLHNNMNAPMELLQDATGPVAEAFREAMWDTFRITNQEGFYPMMKEYGLHSHTLIPTNIRSAFKLNDWESYTSYIFGKTRTPRLKVAVGNTEPYVVALAHQFRGLVDDEILYKFVENTKFDDELAEQFKPHAPTMRHVVKRLTPESRRKILTRGIDYLDTQRIKIMSGQRPGNTLGLNRFINDINADSWSALITQVYGKRFDDVNYLSSV